MNGNPSVIAALQSAAAGEGHLNLQYRLDVRTLKYMGIAKTAKKVKGFGDDAHGFLKAVSKRVLFLGGVLSYSPGEVKMQSSLTALLQNELALEMAIVTPYEEAIQLATRALDDTTRNLFEHLLKWHQEHVYWLEQQLRLISGLTEEGYIAEKL